MRAYIRVCLCVSVFCVWDDRGACLCDVGLGMVCVFLSVCARRPVRACALVCYRVFLLFFIPCRLCFASGPYSVPFRVPTHCSAFVAGSDVNRR